MIALYDATILLSIGLITVLGVIFAVATTFLGRSFEEAREAKKQADQEEGGNVAERISKIRESMSGMSSGKDLSNLEQQLKKAQKDLRKSQGKWQKAITRHQLLTVWGAVIIPGLFFLTAILFSAFAKGTAANAHGFDSPLWWVGSLVALTGGTVLLLLTLREIERIASSSEEASFAETVAALKRALTEKEEETFPVCTLQCEEELPIRMAPNEQRQLRFRAEMPKGRVIHDVNVWLYVPSGFEIMSHAIEPVPNSVRVGYAGWTRAKLNTIERIFPSFTAFLQLLSEPHKQLESTKLAMQSRQRSTASGATITLTPSFLSLFRWIRLPAT